MSSGNYIERAITGLKPEVANTHAFTPRLMKALNYPKLVLPTHWDNFEAPLSDPPTDLRGVYGDPAKVRSRKGRLLSPLAAWRPGRPRRQHLGQLARPR
jgi:hypothetical protein